jgi:AcrR family transcriptional regulator
VARSTRSGSAAGGRWRVDASCDTPSAQVAEIQRNRLFAAALGAIEEHGYAHATVAQITARSRVSRRTFYELFENREACLIALLEDVIRTLEDELAAADLAGLAWRERVRGGLWVILCFFDREPALARVLMDQSAHSGRLALKHRQRLNTRLVAILDEGRAASTRADECSPLTAEGLLGAAAGIINARLWQRTTREPLAALLGELMSMIVLPYLGAAVARRERVRPAPTSPVNHAHANGRRLALECDPLQELPIRMTYRTARVLEVIAFHPGVSNRMVAEHAGIHDQGQISKLLARLERLGLTANSGVGHLKGEPNAWELTPLGRHVEQRLRGSTRRERQVA